MRSATLDLLACPVCHGCLDYAGVGKETYQTGLLICSPCKKEYSIVDGIPPFLQPEALIGLNRRFSRMYDWFSWIYRLFSKVAFAYIGIAASAHVT